MRSSRDSVRDARATDFNNFTISGVNGWAGLPNGSAQARPLKVQRCCVRKYREQESAFDLKCDRSKPPQRPHDMSV